MPFFEEKKDILELQFDRPNVNFLVDEQSEAIKLYKLIKRLDFREFYKRYTDKGAVAYRPEVMFAIIILSAIEGVLSSRAIENRCKRDVYYIYFTEYRKPDHSTIARFLKKFRKEIYGLLPQLISLAKQNNLSTFESIAIDGSKFQSKSSKKHSMRMQELEKENEIVISKIKQIISIIEENDRKEDKDDKEQKKLQAEKKKLEDRQKKLEQSKLELAKRQEAIREKGKRENHQINIEETDARMMKEINSNGYNIQLAVDVETQIIVNASVESDRSDNHQFSKQHKKSEEILGGEDKQREYLADGGYISSETIDYVEEKSLNAYINDSREKMIIPSVEELLKRGKNLTTEYFIYSREDKQYICPNHRSLKQVKTGIYQSEDCKGCLIKDLCARKKNLRTIKRTEFTERKELMRQKIKQSPEKMNLRKAVERVFGNIKWNLGFRRFTRKGFQGASIEITVIVLALNIKKLLNKFSLFLRTILSINPQYNPYLILEFIY